MPENPKPLQHFTKEDRDFASIAQSAEDTDSKKRLFVGLIIATSLGVSLFLALLWLVPYWGLSAIHPWAPALLGLVVGAAMILVLWAGTSLTMSVVLGRNVLCSRGIRGLTVKLFLPLMTLLGRAIGISKQRIRSSFIKVNNELVGSEAGRYPAEKLLLLMPHCLQSSRCKFRLTYNIDNCKRCGKCPMTGLLKLRDKYGVHLAVATGGTIARRIVVRLRPKLILAVACERDLSSGIQDVYPLPAFGVLNERPNGPCLDTLVNVDRLEQAVVRFLDDESMARAREKELRDKDAEDAKAHTPQA